MTAIQPWQILSFQVLRFSLISCLSGKKTNKKSEKSFMFFFLRFVYLLGTFSVVISFLCNLLFTKQKVRVNILAVPKQGFGKSFTPFHTGCSVSLDRPIWPGFYMGFPPCPPKEMIGEPEQKVQIKGTLKFVLFGKQPYPEKSSPDCFSSDLCWPYT